MYRAGRPSPGARLLTAASLVQKGHTVADIGCDHGKLAVWLVLRGHCPKVVAVDARPLPLARAQALARQCKVASLVDCRLGDGLGPVLPGEAQEIVIAGLSGETIAEILAKAPWLRQYSPHLILQPACRAEVLRRWLCENGFSIEQEKPVEERGRAYTTLLVKAGGRVQAPTPLFCELGLLPKAPSAAAVRLVQGRLVDLKNRLKAPLTKAEKEALQALIQEAEECLKFMR